jgi:hypothetical protein
MGWQRAVAQKILGKKADYIFLLKSKGRAARLRGAAL